MTRHGRCSNFDGHAMGMWWACFGIPIRWIVHGIALGSDGGVGVSVLCGMVWIHQTSASVKCRREHVCPRGNIHNVKLTHKIS